MIDFKLSDDEGAEFTVTADSRDMLRWENAGKSRSFGEFGEEIKLGDMYEIAFYAARRMGHVTGDRPKFERTWRLEFDGDQVAEALTGEPDPT